VKKTGEPVERRGKSGGHGRNSGLALSPHPSFPGGFFAPAEDVLLTFLRPRPGGGGGNGDPRDGDGFLRRSIYAAVQSA